MSRRSRKSIAILYVGLLTVFPVVAQTLLPPPTDDGMLAAEPEPVRRWLDEVRAQRQLRQERRRAAQEARDMRWRWIDPWGTRQELRERETQRRHDAFDAFLEHIERDREAFRNQVPWRPRQSPWQDEASEPPATSPRSPLDDAAEVVGPVVPKASTYPLPGWDNRWYYRGF